jgi:glycerate 2-kinase
MPVAQNGPERDARRLLEDLYRAAVASVDPAGCVSAALSKGEPASYGIGPRVLALGKAALPMCRGAIEHLASRGRAASRTLIVTTAGDEAPIPGVEIVHGNHPVPGAESFAAAERIAGFVDGVSAGDDVLVLLSGGTSSLIAAPVRGVSTGDLTRLFENLLGSGADIAATNAIRKRFSRWAAGRLAVALSERGAARVRCLIVSDVIGDDPAVIASGPCVADALTAGELLGFVERQKLQSCLTPALLKHLEAVVRGELPETPKPDDSAFRPVSSEIILSNRSAREGASRRARAMGLSPVRVVDKPLDGDAALTGRELAEELVRFRDDGEQRAARGCMIWGGETTVRLDASSAPGGRCQELAMAAARRLDELGERADGITLLAAGTDGRDGPTDAAGAVVDRSTWRTIASASRDPARDLETHATHAALGSVGALLHSKGTETNVSDIVIGLVKAPSIG